MTTALQAALFPVQANWAACYEQSKSGGSYVGLSGEEATSKSRGQDGSRSGDRESSRSGDRLARIINPSPPGLRGALMAQILDQPTTSFLGRP